MADFNETNRDFVRDYESPGVAQSFSGAVRFGHSANFADLFGTSEEAEDYLRGLFLLGIILFAIFVVWMLIILLFMCLGPDRVGFLSGRPMERTYHFVNEAKKQQQQQSRSRNNTTRDEDDDDDNTDALSRQLGSSSVAPVEETSYRQRHTKTTGGCRCCCGIDSAWWIRGTFVLSGIGFILFTVLLITLGLTNLQGTVDTVASSSEAVKLLSSEAREVIQTGLIDIQGSAISLRDTLIAELARDQLCPANPDLETSDTARQIKDLTAQAVDYLNLLDNVVDNQILDIQAALAEAEKGAQTVQEETEPIDLTDWEALIILIPYTIVPCLLVASAIMAAFDVSFPTFDCVLNWFVFPLFVIMVVIAAVVSTVTVSAASANSDFCVPQQSPEFQLELNSPDWTVLQIIEKEGYTSDTIEYKVGSFYVQQCVAEDPFGFVKEYLPQLQDSTLTIDQLKNTFSDDNTVTELQLYCGREFDTLDQALIEMEKVLKTLYEAAIKLLGIISCERIVPIYHAAVYDGACQYSVKAFAWTFSAAFVMSGLGLLMIMFRSAYKPTDYTNMYDTKYPMVDSVVQEVDPIERPARY